MPKNTNIFDKIFDDFVDKQKNKSSIECSKLFDILKENIVKNEKSIFSFLKYLNIFNVVEENEVGNIGFYADFIHSEKEIDDKNKCIKDKDKKKLEKFTNDRDCIYLGENGKKIFDKNISDTIGQGFRKKKVFDEIFEYNLSASTIDKDLDYSTYFENSSFKYSINLKNLLKGYTLDEKGKETPVICKDKFNNWLNALKEAYPTNNKGNGVTHFYFLIGPVFFGSMEETEEQKLANYVVSANVGIAYSTKMKTEIKKFLKHLKTFINKLTFFIILRIKEEKYIEMAVRASLAQVMARNLSHNIGSHVLVKVVEMINKQLPSNWNCYKKLYLQCEEVIKEVKEDNTKIKKACIEIGFNGNENIIKLLNYIRERMDFIADICTSTPVMETTTTLGALVDGFRENRLIADTISGISGNEKFKYKFDITGNENSPLSIPNDILGFHAFYTIIENLIRNFAKHGGLGSKTTFKIEIEDIAGNEFEETIIDDIEEMSAVTIIIENDIPGKVFIKKNKEEGKDWVETNSIDKEKQEIDKIDWLVYQLNNWLNKSVINRETMSVRHGGWGMLEMAASAAYLRKIPMEDIEKDEFKFDVLGKKSDNGFEVIGCNIGVGKNDDCDNYSKKHSSKKRLNIFKVLKYTKEKDKNYLAYRFFVNKPREVLIIGEDKNIFSDYNEDDKTDKSTLESNKKKWLKGGIKIINESEFKDALEKEKIFPHRLVVNCIDKSKEYKEKGLLHEKLDNNPCFTRRIVGGDKFLTISSEKEDNSNNKIIEKYWKKYIAQFDVSYNIDKGFENKENVYFNFNDYQAKCISSHGTGYFTQNFFEYRVNETSATALWNCQKNNNTEDNNKEFCKIFKLVIGKNCWVNIKILDERIQQHALHAKYPRKVVDENDSNPKDIDFYTLYRYNNIFIPVTKGFNPQYFRINNQTVTVHCCDNKFDLNEKSFNSNYLEIINYINSDSINIDFLIIHLGIIEKLIYAFNATNGKNWVYNTNKEGIESFLKNEILSKNKNINYDQIVVISGRGKPHNIPDNIRYLNFSVVAQYLIDRQHKFPLTEVIYNARKSKK